MAAEVDVVDVEDEEEEEEPGEEDEESPENVEEEDDEEDGEYLCFKGEESCVVGDCCYSYPKLMCRN